MYKTLCAERGQREDKIKKFSVGRYCPRCCSRTSFLGVELLLNQKWLYIGMYIYTKDQAEADGRMYVEYSTYTYTHIYIYVYSTL